MAARGTTSKELITNVLFQIFPNAFVNGKDIRIPIIENGEEVQIKIALTAAKDNVSYGDAAGETDGISNQWHPPSQEEINKVISYLKDMGF